MKYEKSLQKVLEYMEENLYEDLNLDQLARAAGYSKYHFLRIFKEAFHMTPAEYVRRRRITESVRDISDTDEPISWIGYRHGFNSKENFTRVFKSEHHILPSEYRTADNSLKLLHRAKPEKDDSILESKILAVPEIVELRPFSATVYKSDEEDPTMFWNKYNCGGLSGKLSGGEVQTDYGFSVWNFEENRLEYYAGILTEYAHGDLTGTMQLNVNGGLYAVFDTPSADKYTFVNAIRRAWEYIMQEWIPQSGYVYPGDCDFETYRESSREYSERIFIHKNITAKEEKALQEQILEERIIRFNGEKQQENGWIGRGFHGSNKNAGQYDNQETATKYMGEKALKGTFLLDKAMNAYVTKVGQ